MNIEIDPTAEIEINPTTEVEETFTTITEVIGPIIETEVDQEIIGMEMVIEETTIPKTIEEIIIDRIMVIKGIGIEVQVRTMVGLGRDIEAIPEITSEIGHMTEVKVEIERESRNRDRSSSTEEGQRSGTESRDRDRNRERESRSTTRSRSSSGVNTNRDRLRCYRCREHDHFARECPNMSTDDELGSESEELDDSTWQMLSQVETSPFQDFDVQDLNM